MTISRGNFSGFYTSVEIKLKHCKRNKLHYRNKIQNQTLLEIKIKIHYVTTKKSLKYSNEIWEMEKNT
jgi:hypothetical protein